MPELSLGVLAAAAGGTLARGAPETRVTSCAIDTRTLARGGAFFALRGLHRDGHAFLAEAARAGAVAAVVDRELPPDAPAPPALIRVDDTKVALGLCGAAMRRQLASVLTVALTGSSGKTTTKELLAAGLAGTFRVHKSTGNLNNELGVPLTLLECPENAEARL